MVQRDVTMVSVKMASSVYTMSKRSARVTLTDKIATFGGTMGLFTGTSFIGLVEILFWIKRVLKRIVCISRPVLKH